ncbi:hypothetical protein I203_102151 [Kwoniella mangroviensis CBS 8507]|uniref:uncharacterized protein n=1 Tax=Kwoniella mangroviensis CBS 8507 TaxID=1296122 RepID=UPI0030326346
MWRLTFYAVIDADSKIPLGNLHQYQPPTSNDALELLRSNLAVFEQWKPVVEKIYPCVVLEGPFKGVYDSFLDLSATIQMKYHARSLTPEEKYFTVYVGEPSLLKDLKLESSTVASAGNGNNPPYANEISHSPSMVAQHRYPSEKFIPAFTPLSSSHPVPEHIMRGLNNFRYDPIMQSNFYVSRHEDEGPSVNRFNDSREYQSKEGRMSYLFRLQLPPSTSAIETVRRLTLFYKKDTLPDAVTLKIIAFRHLCEAPARKSIWKANSEDEADFVEHHEVKVGDLLYQDWTIRQRNGKAQENTKKFVQVNIHFETVTGVPQTNTATVTSTLFSFPPPLAAKPILGENGQEVYIDQHLAHFKKPLSKPVMQSEDVAKLAVPSCITWNKIRNLENIQLPTITTQSKDQEEMALASNTFSPEEERWSYYGHNQKAGKAKQLRKDEQASITYPSFIPSSHAERNSHSFLRQLFGPPPCTPSSMPPGYMSMISPNNYQVPGPVQQIAPWMSPSGPGFVSVPTSPHPLYFEFHVIDFYLKPIGPSPWVFSELPTTDILRTMLGRYIGADNAQKSRLSVLNDKIHTDLLYERFITSFWDGHGGWECYKRGLLSNRIQIQVWSSGEFVKAETVPPLPKENMPPTWGSMSKEVSNFFDDSSSSFEKKDEPVARSSSTGVKDDLLAEDGPIPRDNVKLAGPNQHYDLKEKSTGRFGFKLEETLESRSETPVDPSMHSSLPDGKDLAPAPAKELPALPPAIHSIDIVQEVPNTTSEHSLERVTSRGYLEDLISSSGNTTASTRLLRIMQAESVSPASSLGLKLLDLAKALRTDGELAPSKPVENTTTNTKVEIIENRLNEFADMLNHIAESVGVALDTSSSSSSSSSSPSTISDEIEDEDGSTTATVGEIPSGLSFSQLAIAGQQVNESIDAIQSPYRTTVSLLETPTVPSAKADLGKLVEEAEKLEKEEVNQIHTPSVAEPKDMGGARLPKSTSHIRAHPVPTKQQDYEPSRNEYVAMSHSQVQGLVNPFAPPPQFGYSYRPYPRTGSEGYSQVPAPTSFHQAPGQGGMLPHSSVYPSYHSQYMYNNWHNGPSNNGVSGNSPGSGVGVASQHGIGAGAGPGAGFGFAQYSQVNPYAGLGNCQYQGTAWPRG